MPLFSYTAKNVSGEHVSNVIEAESIKAVANKLRTSGFFPITILPHNESRTLTGFQRKKIGHKDIVVFTRRLADSLKGGLPLARSLKVLQNQTENKGLAKITQEIAASIQEGRSLSQALKDYPKVFPVMYRAMVQAGETAGVLDVVLSRLADFNEKEEELHYRIQSALAYPVVMLFVGMASVIFLLSFVIPRFELMFQDLGQSMPLPTRILLLLSNVLRFYWWAYIPAAIISIVAARKWYSTESGKRYLANMLLHLPIIGTFIKKDIISRFIRMLSILLSNGVPILDALSIARNSIDNPLFSSDIERIYISVKEGQGLSKPINQSSIFPSLVSEMIAIGEETGNLESSLNRVAEMYEREVEYAIKTMTSLLEPVIILFAGIVVCFIALSMLLPVFQVSSGLR
ncbi:MAG: hypothetical protein A2293_10320 [Elusimicrobia bacterium RIFOXYB2_FULL_49_7]|nr:MAG: hypothetical protein A2293_10320 [Elusimicrobia bacterium RIFOXYB2_FULL_49_7]